jgi:hypothetical protein
MPIYDTAAAAEALGISAKQFDNILSRHALPGIEKQRRGVGRRIGSDAVLAVFIAVEIVRAARVPLAVALQLARTSLMTGGEATVGEFAVLTIDLAAVRASVATRLDAAVELVGRRPRGRRASNRVN